MSSFFSSLANKAQSAYEQSPISSQVQQLQTKLGQHGTEGAAGGAEHSDQPTGIRGNIVHQFRNLQLQYASVDPVQRILTSQKGVSLDYESISKDAKSQSKELYMWGQSGYGEDIRDVTDRLAYLNFVHGSLAFSLSRELNTSRTTFKTLRDAERALEPRRKARNDLQNQIGTLEASQKKKNEKQIAELRDHLEKMEKEDFKAEGEIHELRRKAVSESERAKWAALREYGEKLILLAEASAPIISALPQTPPTEAAPYKGKDITAQTRASLQKTLDNYLPGTIGHSFHPNADDMKRVDSRSFGVTHATELSGIESPGVPGQQRKSTEHLNLTAQNMPPPPTHPDTTKVLHTPSPPSAFPGSASSPPINPSSLNTAPAPIPAKAPLKEGTPPGSGSGSIPIPEKIDTHPAVLAESSNAMPPPEMGTSPIKVPEPSWAETGKPISAGPDGPGPVSGSLKDLRSPDFGKPPMFGAPVPVMQGAPASSAGTSSVTGRAATYASADEEKARLQREERERLARETAKPISAEDEKKELEKKEKQRLMDETAARQAGQDGKGDDAMPPAYQDM